METIQHARRTCVGVLTALLLMAGSVDAQIPASAYPARRSAALAALRGNVLIVPARASFLADDQLGFVQTADFQYLTGLGGLVGAVLVLDGSTSASTLFVQPRNPLLTRGDVVPDAASARSLQLSAVEPIDKLEPWLKQRLARGSVTAYVAATDVRGPVAAPLPMAGSVARWQAWLASLGAASVKPAIEIIRPLRDIKDDSEIAVLREVGRTSGEAFMTGMRALAPQKWQHETELAVVNACRAAGARGVSFWPWTMSGPNADFHSLWNSFLSYDHVDRQMQTGEVVRVDVGCQVDHYMGDADRNDWRASPARSKLEGLPPAYVLVAGADPLRDEGNEYAERLKAAGVPVTYRYFPGQFHGFFTMGKLLNQANIAASEISAWLKAQG